MNQNPLAEFASRFSGTRAFQRIRDVSFLGVLDRDLSRMRPNVTVYSRAQHSEGVAKLAMRVCWRAMLSKSDSLALVAAALLHDIAHPAFSHSLEYAFDKKDRTLDHHSVLHELLLHPSAKTFDLFRILKSYDVSPARIWDILDDADPLSFFFVAPINIDTIDGITRAYWTIGSFVQYDYRVVTDVLAAIYCGESITGENALLQLDRFWLSKGAFYEKFLTGSAGALEKSFQKDVREKIDTLDRSLFEMSDKDFELRYPEVVRRDRRLTSEQAPPSTQHFYVDDSVRTVDKKTIYQRYRRVKSGNQPTGARAAGLGQGSQSDQRHP